MCGRYSETTAPKVLAERFKASLGVELKARFNIAPSQDAPVVVLEKGREIRLFRWGLIPAWAKDMNIGYSLINARADTIQEKPSYKKPFERSRCLVLADGFFEWKHPAGAKKGIPHRVTMKSGEPFAMAGIWDTWKKPDGSELRSFAVVTTDAAKSIMSIHDRMPVILDPGEYDAWLDAKTDVAKLLPMLNPLEDDKIDAYEVSTLVNSPKNDTPDVVKPAARLIQEDELF